jgi:bifunctional non-homologous end joining protein LigD
MRYQPMLCMPGDERDLSRKGYSYEVKLDGTRMLLYKEGNKLTGVNRRNSFIMFRYPELLSAFKKGIKAKSCVLDGEIVVYGKRGMPNFNLLQAREQLSNKLLIEMRSKQHPAVFVVFDILEKDGKRLTWLPLNKRRKILKQTIEENAGLQLMFHTAGGKKLWKEIKKKRLEGVVAKKNDSEYVEGRSDLWLKIKNLKTIDCIIVGYTSGIRAISALCIAAYHKNKPVYIGRVGTGFTEKFLRELKPKLKITKTIPVANMPKTRKKIYWVKPELVCEVRFLQLTKGMKLRAPAFLRMRYDKLPSDCVLENQIK